MSRNNYNKFNNNDSSNADSQECDQCVSDDICRGCIVCPPHDYYEKYESEISDISRPDFSELCDDNNDCGKKKSNKCKNNKCKECNKSSIFDESETESDTESDTEDESNLESESDNFSNIESVPFDRQKKEKTQRKKKELKYKNNESGATDSSISQPIRNNNYYSDSSSGRGKKFIVTFGNKEEHPWAEYNNNSDSIYVNGKNGPVLHLYRDCSYFFCVEQNLSENDVPRHAFVLTNSPKGGPKSKIIPNGFAPISKGCVCFKVDKCTPRYFYYQCSKKKLEGGLVIVHDKV